MLLYFIPTVILLLNGISITNPFDGQNINCSSSNIFSKLATTFSMDVAITGEVFLEMENFLNKDLVAFIFMPFNKALSIDSKLFDQNLRNQTEKNLKVPYIFFRSLPHLKH
jgi:hypothetical protein